jgi:hypothetical protein
MRLDSLRLIILHLLLSKRFRDCTRSKRTLYKSFFYNTLHCITSRSKVMQLPRLVVSVDQWSLLQKRYAAPEKRRLLISHQRSKVTQNHHFPLPMVIVSIKMLLFPVGDAPWWLILRFRHFSKQKTLANLSIASETMSTCTVWRYFNGKVHLLNLSQFMQLFSRL